MKNKAFAPVLFFSLLYFLACNPDCDSLPGLQVSTQINPSGHQVMITASPLSALEGRSIFFDRIPAQAIFVENNGLLVTVPEGVSGKVELRIEDPDCVDFITIDFDVVDETFFQDNPTYIFPPTPEIIIPNSIPVFPPSIENAWLHPINTDYCFWLKLLPDNSGSCTKFIDPLRSSEQSICDNTDVLYASNPLSGRIEPDGSVFVTVNRPGGAEEFSGKLINAVDVPAKYREWENLDCNGSLNSSSWPSDFKNRDFMMLLTSKLTGRQLLIYQQNIPGVSIDCI